MVGIWCYSKLIVDKKGNFMRWIFLFWKIDSDCVFYGNLVFFYFVVKFMEFLILMLGIYDKEGRVSNVLIFIGLKWVWLFCKYIFMCWRMLFIVVFLMFVIVRIVYWCWIYSGLILKESLKYILCLNVFFVKFVIRDSGVGCEGF